MDKAQKNIASGLRRPSPNVLTTRLCVCSMSSSVSMTVGYNGLLYNLATLLKLAEERD